MDIYKEILAELAVEQLNFDESNVCSFEIQQEKKPESAPFVINIVRNTALMELAISVTTAADIPAQISKELFRLLGVHAIGPLRGDCGVGVYPGTEQLTVFTKISLAEYRPGQIKENLAELLDKAQEWESILLVDTHPEQEQDKAADASSCSWRNIRV
ncbi:hypothetical protein Sps_01266 [Shewanella psychrophila]|uniref:Tir chaperone protein (CesT) family n=1 Tax=Shewanella psychrophila TaxID=225848 RepID=A0A1S6HLM5_9GAMM|nr:CesT family type III secretion system chaperone [Shewanella psychrophila]AQS36435.1 hypothetical protein Sps_01266 [Shewanella psychrophila]